MGGLAVEIGAQIRGRAASGEVLVSSTEKDLVAGSGIRFINHGLHTLDGIAGDWQLFKVERQERLLRDEG